MSKWDEILKYIDELQSAGYAVVVFSPDEIGKADREQLEDIMIERGSEYISSENSRLED